MVDDLERYDTASWYQIRVKGHLDLGWFDWFDGLLIQNQENGQTVLIGPASDQTILQWVLDNLWSLGLTVLSFHQLEAEKEICFLKQSKSYALMIVRRSNRLHILLGMRAQVQIAELTYLLTPSEMNGS